MLPRVLSIQEIAALNGAIAVETEAFVFGGGNMFPQLYAQRHVGDRNAQVVLELLEAAGVAPCHTDTGGTRYRRLRWTVGPGLPEVSTGEVAA